MKAVAIVMLLAASSLVLMATHERSEAAEIALTLEEQKACEKGGGCVLVPQKMVEQLLEEAFMAGFEKGKDACYAKRKKEA